jgi:hypothetical protein
MWRSSGARMSTTSRIVKERHRPCLVLSEMKMTGEVRRTLLPTVVFVLVGCASSPDGLDRTAGGGALADGASPYAVRHVSLVHAPLMRGEPGHPSVGILEVQVDDKVLAEAPIEFANIPRLVVETARRQLQQGAQPLEVVDYTDLGYVAPWRESTPRAGQLAFQIDGLPDLPLGVQTSLVTTVKVLDWQLLSMSPRRPDSAARVELLMSTWSLDGRPMRTSLSFSTVLAKEPEQWQRAFWEAIRDAVERHYRPFLPFWQSAGFIHVEGKAGHEVPFSALERGELDVARLAWESLQASEPTDHAALYNSALLYDAQGDSQTALQLIERALQQQGLPRALRKEYEAGLQRVTQRQEQRERYAREGTQPVRWARWFKTSTCR